MIWTKLLSWISIFVYTFTFFLASFTVWMPPAQADCVFIFFCSPEKSSFRSKGGVGRGPCAGEEIGSLIALAPERKPKLINASGENVGSTVEDYPTFYFYLPPYPSSVKSAKFALLDENRNLVQEPVYAQLPQALEGTIVKLTMPNKGKVLKVGKQYSWYFSILCDSQKPSRNPEVNGQIQLVLPSSLPRDNEPAYIVHDDTYTGKEKDIKSIVFYDTVTQLAENYSAYPSDWSTLLHEAEVPTFSRIVKLEVSDKPPESCDSSSQPPAV
jgi:Domain of Unknown Function (DUF928)